MFLRQPYIFLSGHCMFLRQPYIFLDQHYMILWRYCMFLRLPCIFLTTLNVPLTAQYIRIITTLYVPMMSKRLNYQTIQGPSINYLHRRLGWCLTPLSTNISVISWRCYLTAKGNKTTILYITLCKAHHHYHYKTVTQIISIKWSW